jgi:hypothetical protein
MMGLPSVIRYNQTTYEHNLMATLLLSEFLYFHLVYWSDWNLYKEDPQIIVTQLSAVQSMECVEASIIQPRPGHSRFHLLQSQKWHLSK